MYKFFVLSGALVAVSLSLGCTSNKMLEPDRSMLYNTLMANLIPVTVIECFEPKFNPLKGFDEDARKSLDKCVEKFKADEVQYKAWAEFMKMLSVIAEEEKVNPT